jgi:hypothetical protein
MFAMMFGDAAAAWKVILVSSLLEQQLCQVTKLISFAQCVSAFACGSGHSALSTAGSAAVSQFYFDCHGNKTQKIQSSIVCLHISHN